MNDELLPLGIEPRDIWEKKRMNDLWGAIKRYLDRGLAVPPEWWEEYNELQRKYA